MAAGAWLLAFTAGVAVSLATSWLLVSRLERLGERAGFPEAPTSAAGCLALALGVILGIPDQIFATITQYAFLAAVAAVAATATVSAAVIQRHRP